LLLIADIKVPDDIEVEEDVEASPVIPVPVDVELLLTVNNVQLEDGVAVVEE